MRLRHLLLFADNTDPKPRHCHIRKFTVDILIFDNILTDLFICDYSYYYRENYACRQVCRAHDELPTMKKYHPDCLLSCSQNMHENKECTEIITRSMNLTKKHKLYLISSPIIND